MSIEMIGKVDIDRIIKEISKLDFAAQLPLQGVAGSDSSSDGMVEELDYSETEYNHNLYTDIMPYTYEVIKQYLMYRSRVMKMKEKTCYSYHYDSTKRIHIPLITNWKCFLLIGDKSYHLPADGSVYLVDTTGYHTALNGSRERFDRIHLIGNVTSF